MSAIKPRTRGKHLTRHITQLDRENNETVYAYAAFIGESTSYVLNQLIETVLDKDREFRAWRDTHPGPHTPPPGSRRSRRRAEIPSPVTPPGRTDEAAVTGGVSRA